MHENLTNQHSEYVYKNLKRWTFYFLVFEIVLFSYLIFFFPNEDFYINFFNVGQGDSIFIKTPENHQILIDTGPDNIVVERLLDSMPFFDRKLDMIILTHPDLDHIGGVLDVLKRYSVDYILLTGAPGNSPIYSKFLDEIRKLNINDKTQIIIPVAEQRFFLGEIYFDVLNPFESHLAENDVEVNDISISIQIDYKNAKTLLCGDISIKVEKEMVKKYGSKLKSLVFKANHHGSKGSNDLSFLQVVAPKTVVISSGKDNKFNHPHVEALMNFYRANVEKIYRTDENQNVLINY